MTFINSNSEFINIYRQGLPKKDCGQNRLQVAFKVVNFEIVEELIKKDADTNGIDSYGNSSLMRALLDAKLLIDHPNFNEKLKTLEQTRKKFKLLIEFGADLEYSNEKRPKLLERIKDFGMEKYNLI